MTIDIHHIASLQLWWVLGIVLVNLTIGLYLHRRALERLASGPKNRGEVIVFMIIMSVFGVPVLLWMLARGCTQYLFS